MNKKIVILAALVAAAGSGVASAATSELQLDVNALNGQATDGNGNNTGFGGLTHTGSVVLTNDINSALSAVLIDGTNQGITPGQLSSFSGTIDLVLGAVTGGSLSMTLLNGDTFMATIVGGQGQVNTQSGQGFQIDGLVTSALFGPGPSFFAGVDISPFYNGQPLNGSFLNFTFTPDANGNDANTDIDIFVVIPSPLAGGMAGIGLMGLAARRRRA